MRNIDLNSLEIGSGYTLVELADLWGYKSYNAIRRGIVTPVGQNMIILFITEEKVKDAVQYVDKLENGILTIQGEEKHGNDKRLESNIHSPKDDIYLFHRKVHHTPYIFYGMAEIFHAEIKADSPSEFKFRLTEGQYGSGLGELDILSLTYEKDLESIGRILEGNKKIVQHVAYERSPESRRRAIEIHGTTCGICGVDMNIIYGKDIAESYVEVHHISELHKGQQEVDPSTGLIPLCPNCHRMLHRKKSGNPTIEELRDRVEGFRAHLENYEP